MWMVAQGEPTHYFLSLSVDGYTLCGKPRSSLGALHSPTLGDLIRCDACASAKALEDRVVHAAVTAPMGDRFNTGKWVPTFWPKEALEAAARVWEYGAKKYARDNWRSGMKHREIADCALRHITAWAEGEDNDRESGLHHIWHALCNLAMLCWMIARRPDLDDRYKGTHQASNTKPEEWQK